MIGLSVVIPTHDRPESLSRTVEALLRQSLLPDEIIIVNDHEADIPPAVGESITAAGVSFEYCRLQSPRPSASASRNHGMKLATGGILVMIDDDVLPPTDCLAKIAEMYALAPPGSIAAIGPRIASLPPKNRFGRWLWGVLAKVLGELRWAPRACAGRYAAVPAKLRRCLEPGRPLSGSLMTVRREIADEYRFDEEFFSGGYVLGEDRDFSLRIARDRPVFLATDLVVMHDPHPGGRPDRFRMGRMLVSSTLHTAKRCGDRGAGTLVLLGHEFIGTCLLHAIWGLAMRKQGNLLYATGIAVELLSRARTLITESICR